MFGTAFVFMVISAWLVGGFFTLKKFNEMTQEVESLSYDVERLSYENLKLCRELHPTKLIFFPSTDKMNWFEANRGIFWSSNLF